MKQIVVISGKGGTGKTVITASLAALAENKVMADCDVDAADLHLLLHPEVKEKHPFTAGKTPVIDYDKCIKCGKCLAHCRFEAIECLKDKKGQPEKFVIDPISCEGCAVCSHLCPVEAINMEENDSGQWFISETEYGPMVHAKLGIAEENSGKLVAVVRQQAKLIAEQDNKDYVIIDGPPGIGCPVIASLSGVDAALIVTEPTLSGMHDMERVASVSKHFGVKTFVCINKYDLNMENSEKIEELCRDSGIEVLSKIPFDKKMVESLVKGVPVVQYNASRLSAEIKYLWDKIKSGL